MCWVHLNLYKNSSLNIETFVACAVHSFTSHLCPLEELEVLSFPFFSFSEILNGLSAKSSVLTGWRALHLWGVAPTELIMPRAEHSLVGWVSSGEWAVCSGLILAGLVGHGGVGQMCYFHRDTCWGVTPEWPGPQMGSDLMLSHAFRAGE